MKYRSVMWFFAVALAGLVAACGAVKDKTAEVSNDLNLKGHWLMTESEHASRVETAVEKESMVLTFKDGKAAFSPTDSVKGRAVYATVSHCTAGPRPYHTDKHDIVFEAVTDCPEKRVAVTQLDGDHLKFSDPDTTDVIRTFVRIDDSRYESLVAASDRRP